MQRQVTPVASLRSFPGHRGRPLKGSRGFSPGLWIKASTLATLGRERLDTIAPLSPLRRAAGRATCSSPVLLRPLNNGRELSGISCLAAREREGDMDTDAIRVTKSPIPVPSRVSRRPEDPRRMNNF